MFKEVMEHIKTALILLIVFTLVTGLLYPLAVTGLAQLLFPAKANGSLIKQNDHVIGSQLIGQFFSSPTYFWGRPSATSPYPYNGEASAGSNLGPTNPDFITAVKKRILPLKETSPQNNKGIPVDLVTASGSGLDPDISPYAAYYQAARIAKARNLSLEEVNTLIQKHIKNRTLGLLGEPRVNVLEINLALDNLRMSHDQSTPNS
ncbi:potassium-transporting ATPase subunit KdpC [Fluoribacter dumoffii]|uniref:potassium-transporting ATPase subunit KdpC n=1 Tax=Fluoribacter dumoffii TaxID=463 RepID=UPI002242E3D6|nr:potassium-transporting ATPase subunit KdpC [Fluoribacter dumoffii]MCW8418886.1 potassium-transporting ATPase subunit KdpC [Fluoribacter dumoffii]MCW8453270.1 potassium-transporting ATPase subunit KdpC [Fluoribacter dumoffii]MCW8459509.1 potassium-transporting ATPase subunit KdpC [Fluoribacter dumoffii]MCW8482869.1 potassium-transporting ATPase subunit KdpC [Fluoribacter dumoffii]